MHSLALDCGKTFALNAVTKLNIESGSGDQPSRFSFCTHTWSNSSANYPELHELHQVCGSSLRIRAERNGCLLCGSERERQYVGLQSILQMISLNLCTPVMSQYCLIEKTNQRWCIHEILKMQCFNWEVLNL